MRSVMRACIGSNRAPDGRYAEIDLPASPYRLLNALDEIGIKSTKEIVYQEILNYGSFGYLEPHFDEYTMLEELNALAQKLAVFDRVDSIAFEGLVKTGTLWRERTHQLCAQHRELPCGQRCIR